MSFAFFKAILNNKLQGRVMPWKSGITKKLSPASYRREVLALPRRIFKQMDPQNNALIIFRFVL